MKFIQEYILRYYLPIKPIYDEDYTHKRFQELLSFCKKNKVDAVMFYVALNPHFYYMPDSYEYTKKTIEQMIPYINIIRENGIGYQINFQNLLGSTLGGADFSDIYDWEFLVDQKGNVSKGCACPIGKKFRELSQKRLIAWAKTNPDIIWLDDDFRLHNHGTGEISLYKDNNYYYDFYCYCDEHIKLFNEKYHYNYDRASLINEIFKINSKSDIRVQYLDFLSDTMVNTASWIEKTIHGVNPSIKIAQMTSVPDVHAAEGRNWNDFLSALTGEHKAIIRPHFGPYMENSPRDFIMCYRMLAQSIAQISAEYKGQIEFCPEVENSRFTVWAKSKSATTFQLALSTFMGCNKVTLSLYDLDGASFSDDLSYGTMLRKNKAILNKIASLNLSSASSLGIAIPFSQKSGRNYIFSKADNQDAIAGSNRYIENYFLKMGIPCKYVDENLLDKEDIVALDGFSASFLPDNIIRKILRGNVFIEGNAMEILSQRGFSNFIGIIKFEKSPISIHSENINTFTRKDGTFIRLPSRIEGNKWFSLQIDNNVNVLTNFIDPKGNMYPGCILYKNIYGGTVVTYPVSNNWGSGFFTHYRVKLFKEIFYSLSSNFVKVDCNSYILSVCKQCSDGKKYYLITNLSTDSIKKVMINDKQLNIRLHLYQTAIICDNKGYLKKITIV